MGKYKFRTEGEVDPVAKWFAEEVKFVCDELTGDRLAVYIW
jgi:hypothetical protein